MAATHQHHSADIRAEAVKRVAAGEKRAAVARSMGLAHDTVCRWTKPAPAKQYDWPGMDWFIYRKGAE